MTCIVGFVDKGKVYMGADSAGVDSAYNISIRKDRKIFKNGEFLIGCTSSFRMIQLLMFSLKPPKIGKKDIFEYMCTDFIDAVRKSFDSGGFLQKNKENQEEGGTFLVGVRGRLFRIEDDFQVEECLDKYNACGCGVRYAKGSLYTTKDSEESPEKIITLALKAAEYHSSGVSAPFHIESI